MNPLKFLLSGLNAGRYYPEPGEQQVFDLFAKRNEPGEKSLLSNTTVIKGVDFLRVRFDNNLSLQKEADAEVNFKEGAIKFELTSPTGCFWWPCIYQSVSRSGYAQWQAFCKEKTYSQSTLCPCIKSDHDRLCIGAF